jgi:hypothetical protein
MGAIKVGCSYGWQDRITSVARNLPFSLEPIAVVQGHLVMEKAVHIYLRKHRIDGEYFHENDVVTKFLDGVVSRGCAFHYFHDMGSDHTPDGAVDAFMKYHGISLREVCDLLEVPIKRYEKRGNSKPNKSIVAATALLAQKDARYVTWPDDALRGLLGEVHYVLRKEEAA